MGRMSELHHETERAAQFMPSIVTLEDYDSHVGNHLKFITAGAEMCARNAQQLVARPTFETLAEGELARAKQVLADALAKVEAATVEFEGKRRAA